MGISNNGEAPPYNTDFTPPAPTHGHVYPSLAQGNQPQYPGYTSPVPPGQAHNVAGQGHHVPSQSQAYPVPVSTNIVYGSPSVFGRDPVTIVCTNCGANITTSTTSETGTVAWISAGVLCAVGFWCCFWIPLTMDKLKDVTHR